MGGGPIWYVRSPLPVSKSDGNSSQKMERKALIGVGVSGRHSGSEHQQKSTAQPENLHFGGSQKLGVEHQSKKVHFGALAWGWLPRISSKFCHRTPGRSPAIVKNSKKRVMKTSHPLQPQSQKNGSHFGNTRHFFDSSAIPESLHGPNFLICKSSRTSGLGQSSSNPPAFSRK